MLPQLMQQTTSQAGSLFIPVNRAGRAGCLTMPFADLQNGQIGFVTGSIITFLPLYEFLCGNKIVTLKEGFFKY